MARQWQQDPWSALATPRRLRGARRRRARALERRLPGGHGGDRQSVRHGGRGVLQRHRHAGRRPDLVTLRGEGSRWRATRHPRGLHRADGLNRPVRRVARRGGGAARPGAGWETGTRGRPGRPFSPHLRAGGSEGQARAGSCPSRRLGRSERTRATGACQSSNMTVMSSPASTPSPSGTRASALAAAVAASALLSCERTPAAT